MSKNFPLPGNLLQSDIFGPSYPNPNPDLPKRQRRPTLVCDGLLLGLQGTLKTNNPSRKWCHDLIQFDLMSATFHVSSTLFEEVSYVVTSLMQAHVNTTSVFAT